MSLRFKLLTLLWLTAAGGASGQQAPAAAMPDEHFIVLGGASLVRIEGTTTESPGLHLTAGATAGAATRGWGILGLGMIGRSGGYESTLLGAALSRRVVRGGNWSILAFGGVGTYAETGETGTERDAFGALFGGTARYRVGGVTLAAQYSHVTGTYDKPDVSAPFRFHVPRISVGVGF
jgi:hypothetical protein